MILPLEKQVCSLEYARELKELGVRQESICYWVFNPFGDKNYKLSFFGHKVQSDNFDIVSAFTVAELGERLPKDIEWQLWESELEFKDGGCINKQFEKFRLETWFSSDQWFCGYHYHGKFSDNQWSSRFQTLDLTGKNTETACVGASTEANARAKMLIYLIKNGIVKP